MMNKMIDILKNFFIGFLFFVIFSAIIWGLMYTGVIEYLALVMAICCSGFACYVAGRLARETIQDIQERKNNVKE